jgi:lysophospholipase L1-like esterase
MLASLVRGTRAWWLLGVSAVVLIVGSITAWTTVAAEPPPPPTCPGGWVTAWAASPQPLDTKDAAMSAPGGRTLRLIIKPQTDGSAVRIRLSNAFGAGAVVIGASTIGIAQLAVPDMKIAPALQGQKSLPVLFGGSHTATLPAHGSLVSDPVALPVAEDVPVAVSIFLPERAPVATGHVVALQTSYLSGPGDFTADTGGDPFATHIDWWPLLAGLDVETSKAVNSVYVLGDSLTDGIGTQVDKDDRFTDALAKKLADASGGTIVINGGIAGSLLLPDDPAESPVSRLERDLPLGATDVILEIGNNDLAQGRKADELEPALTDFVKAGHARGLRVFLTTITPAIGNNYGTPAAITARNQVDEWMRTTTVPFADGFFDVARAIQSTQQPRIDPRLDTDGLHPSALGYQTMADAVDITQLTPSCP